MRKKYLHDMYGENDTFWDRNWDGDWRKRFLAKPQVMSRLVACMMKYLKPGMLLLEGGCGDGKYVRYFTDLGIKTIGVDFARTTVQKINELLPNLDIRAGDIRKFDFPDRYFDAYYSGGVIEHFEDGIGPQLVEAHRILKCGGYFFVTVPHMTLARKFAAVIYSNRYKIDLDGRKSYFKEGMSEFVVEKPPEDYHFHEYTFTTSEMREFLKSHGFRIVEEMCFSSSFGFVDIQPYRRLMGADLAQRTIINKFFAIPHKCVRLIEDSESAFCHILSYIIGLVFGNLKLYVCRAEK